VKGVARCNDREKVEIMTGRIQKQQQGEYRDNNRENTKTTTGRVKR